MSQLRAEFLKAVSLPAVWVAGVIAVFCPMLFTAITVMQIHRNRASGRTGAFVSTVDLGFSEFLFTMITAIVVGVVIASSEYTPSNTRPGAGRQVTTTLIACPHRLKAFVTKTFVLAGLSVVLASLSIGLAMTVASTIDPQWGETPRRFVGAVFYWTMVALMSYSVAFIMRTTLVPIAVLGLNQSFISISFLLLKVTSLAKYLPDLAGVSLVSREAAFKPLQAELGAIVMSSWTIILLAIACLCFVQRDA